MFKTARLKLTAWYLAIIMTVSLFFSAVIYMGINAELTRIERVQTARQQERQELLPFLNELSQERRQLGLPPLQLPPDVTTQDINVVSEARTRLISILGIVNLGILVGAGLAGYFLAGRTLTPIAEMVEEQKDFVSNASHELRTPLTSLRSEIEVALRDLPAGTQARGVTMNEIRHLLQSNLEEVEKMSQLSSYLLELNRYQSGRVQPTASPLDLKDVAIRAIEKMARAAHAREITIIPKLASVPVKGDADSLVQLVAILLDNAIKYSPKKSKITVVTQKKTRGGVIEVKDEGIGITKTDLPHIFDRFYRADMSRNKEKVSGYGLGLALAKSICDANGGNIKVQSRPGRGSTFSVQI